MNFEHVLLILFACLLVVFVSIAAFIKYRQYNASEQELFPRDTLESLKQASFNELLYVLIVSLSWYCISVGFTLYKKWYMRAIH
jgi:hypothetical protein